MKFDSVNYCVSDSAERCRWPASDETSGQC